MSVMTRSKIFLVCLVSVFLGSFYAGLKLSVVYLQNKRADKVAEQVVTKTEELLKQSSR